jgi:hypothetical protein
LITIVTNREKKRTEQTVQDALYFVSFKKKLPDQWSGITTSLDRGHVVKHLWPQPRAVAPLSYTPLALLRFFVQRIHQTKHAVNLLLVHGRFDRQSFREVSARHRNGASAATQGEETGDPTSMRSWISCLNIVEKNPSHCKLCKPTYNTFSSITSQVGSKETKYFSWVEKAFRVNKMSDVLVHLMKMWHTQ